MRAAGGRRRRSDRGRRRVPRPALHDVRPGRRHDDGPQQRRARPSPSIPLREPAGVDLRARLRPDVKPQRRAGGSSRARVDAPPTRAEPRIDLEELDADEVVVRIAATPDNESDGPRLADEILAAIGSLAQEGHRRARPRAAGAGATQRFDALRLRTIESGDRLGAAAGAGSRDLRATASVADAAARPRRSPRAHRSGRDVDLGAVLLDRRDDAGGDLLRRAGADERRQLGAGLGEHARVADEAGVDDGHADAGADEVLAQAQREAAHPELGRAVDRRAGRDRLARQRGDEDEVAGAARRAAAGRARGRARSARAG